MFIRPYYGRIALLIRFFLASLVCHPPPYLQQWPDLMRPTGPQLLSSNDLTVFWNCYSRCFSVLPFSHISRLSSVPPSFPFPYSFKHSRCFSFPFFSPFFGHRSFTAYFCSFFPSFCLFFAVFSCFWRGVFGFLWRFPVRQANR